MTKKKSRKSGLSNNQEYNKKYYILCELDPINPINIMPTNSVIFISHRSTDKAVADMLLDFFSTTGVSRNAIKCSSLKGNDVKERISKEVREWIQQSVVNIVILSRDFYNSTYCLNEAGILWYLESIPVIPIALSEIESKDMIGFLNDEYKLRRLDSDGDIAYIYDTVVKSMKIAPANHSIIIAETKKLKDRYKQFCDKRVKTINNNDNKSDSKDMKDSGDFHEQGDNLNFDELLQNTYNIMISYRESIKKGDFKTATNTSAELEKSMNEIYLYFERNQFKEPDTAQKALKIIKSYNQYANYFNQFISFPPGESRMSESAQNYAKLADEEFNRNLTYIISLLP